MNSKKNVFCLVLCYFIWGFQPLYWALNHTLDSFMILGCRIVMAAFFSVAILALTGRLSELKKLFSDKKALKYLIPASVFLLLDWAVFLVAVNAGHVLDASLGYYINPLMLFAFGVVIYKEKCRKIQLLALGIAAVGVVISTVTFGSFPYISLFLASNWAVYTLLKKYVHVDGVVSIAAETLMMSPFAIAYLLIFKSANLSSLQIGEIAFLMGTGVVAAMPMFLYSNSVTAFPLTAMCFAQYLSPTFNMICGLILGETFSGSQFVSFAFFIAAIIIFTANEIRQTVSKPQS